MGKGKSIHIGLNNVNPDCYNGWNQTLEGCVNDSNDMRSIAEKLGYESLVLNDAEATADAVVSAMGAAARDLNAGDILFLTFSCHGGQVPDVNGDEPDGLDETLALWDRQLVDDELYALWSHFEAGVRIVVVPDSCHSGTVIRSIGTYAQIRQDVRRYRGRASGEEEAVLSAISDMLLGNDALQTRARGSANTGDSADPEAQAAAVPSSPIDGPTVPTVPIRDIAPGSVKGIPPDVNSVVNASHAEQLASAQWLAGAAERATIGASIILISGCQDNQVSLDGAHNGLFTEKLKAVWDDGKFDGGYRDFWRAIVALMPTNQQPNYLSLGAPSAEFELERPFTV
jgi:hypothetical protein